MADLDEQPPFNSLSSGESICFKDAKSIEHLLVHCTVANTVCSKLQATGLCWFVLRRFDELILQLSPLMSAVVIRSCGRRVSF